MPHTRGLLQAAGVQCNSLVARPGQEGWVLGGIQEFRTGWGGSSPYRKLSSASARGSWQPEPCGCSGSASGSACGSSWSSRGLSQEMVEEVLTSFKVELEEGNKSERSWGRAQGDTNSIISELSVY